MAHSLEIRTPLVDSKLLSDLAPVLIRRQTFHQKKCLALLPKKKLPEEVLNRVKTGFVIPQKKWMEQGHLLDAARRIPLLARPNCHWSRQWAYSVYDHFKIKN